VRVRLPYQHVGMLTVPLTFHLTEPITSAEDGTEALVTLTVMLLGCS